MGIIDSIKAFLVDPPDPPVPVAPATALDRKSGPFYPVNLSVSLSPGVPYGPNAAAALRQAYGGGYALNSAVYACTKAIGRTYNEAPIRLYQLQGGDGEAKPVDDSDVIALLNRPNPWMTGKQMWAYIQWSKAIYGNAYVRKVRQGGPSSPVVELWPISPAMIWPERRANSTNFIDYYRYQFEAGRDDKLPPEDIMHFRETLDDQNHMLGMAPLSHLLREVDTDAQTTAMSDRLVRNNGIPGMVVTLPVDAGDPGPEVAQSFKASITAAFSGENQGSTAVLHGGATADQYGFNPQQMDLSSLHRLPEERIAAGLGVPAIIAGLGAGLDRATYANFKEAREMFVESTIIPLYAEDDDVLTTQLLPEFTDDPAFYLAHDISDMRALQPDMDAMYKRLTLATGRPWLAVNEARSEAGFDASANPEDNTIQGPEAAPDPAALADDPPPGKQGANVRQFGRKALNPTDFERVLLALRAGQERPLEDALTTYLAGLRRRVVQRLEEAG